MLMPTLPKLPAGYAYSAYAIQAAPARLIAVLVLLCVLSLAAGVAGLVTLRDANQIQVATQASREAAARALREAEQSLARAHRAIDAGEAAHQLARTRTLIQASAHFARTEATYARVQTTMRNSVLVAVAVALLAAGACAWVARNAAATPLEAALAGSVGGGPHRNPVHDTVRDAACDAVRAPGARRLWNARD